MLRAAFLALVLLLGAGVAANAQAPAALPAGMTQEQFDSLVDAIARSVTEKLRAQGIAAPAASDAAAKPAKAAPKFAADEPVTVFLGDASRATRALPALGEHLARIPRLLDERGNGGAGPGLFLVWLGLAAILAVAAEALLRRLLARVRGRLASGGGTDHGAHALLNLGLLALLDGLGVVVVWLICHGAIGIVFSGATAQHAFATAMLIAVFAWRLYVLALRIVLQPDQPQARLCAVDDGEALGLYARFSILLAVIIATRTFFSILVLIDTPPVALAAYQAIAGLVGVPLLLWLAVRSRGALRQWLADLGTVSAPARVIGRAWIYVAVPFILALGATQFYGALTQHAAVATALLLTLNLTVALLFFETFLQAIVRRLDLEKTGNAANLAEVTARCLRVAVLIGMAVIVAESWIVDVLALVGPAEWTELTHLSRGAGITLFVAFVLWQGVIYFTEPFMDRRPKGVAQVLGMGDGDEAVRSASRLSTIMPLLRVATATTLLIVTALIVLQSFGVNIVPLLAGASVVGLAISFGSQSLVRDIVSGIFYLSDDAFRVGEYIDCGKAKGTVEGFTLRSIKLRHQNGQVHTIPFGQLGQVTNFSRDWITVKFNLRFARDTDVEKLRKAAKKIGAEMMAQPEYKDEILVPFKMQGVADIVDNALVCRFKFTVRPGNPALIQREAIKRMFRSFPDQGIAFATERPAVVLQSQPTVAPQDAFG